MEGITLHLTIAEARAIRRVLRQDEEDGTAEESAYYKVWDALDRHARQTGATYDEEGD